MSFSFSQRSSLRPSPNDQTLFVKHLSFGLQVILTRFTYSWDLWSRHKTLFDKRNCFENGFEILFSFKHFMPVTKQKMFDEQCFVTWPNVKTFCFRSKSQMFGVSDVSLMFDRSNIIYQTLKICLSSTMFDHLTKS